MPSEEARRACSEIPKVLGRRRSPRLKETPGCLYVGGVWGDGGACVSMCGVSVCGEGVGVCVYG